jgi:hypothetical protein
MQCGKSEVRVIVDGGVFGLVWLLLVIDTNWREYLLGGKRFAPTYFITAKRSRYHFGCKYLNLGTYRGITTT